MKKYIAIILLISLASCTLPTRYEREQNDTGFGNDDYKKSKCACMQFDYTSGSWKWL